MAICIASLYMLFIYATKYMHPTPQIISQNLTYETLVKRMSLPLNFKYTNSSV